MYFNIPEDARPDNCPITPTRGLVVIVRELPEHLRKKVLGGKELVLPDSAKNDKTSRAAMAEAWVMAVGPAKVNAFTENEIPVQVAVGDRVITRGVNPFSTHKNKGSETIWETLDEDAIVGILSHDADAEQPKVRATKPVMG